MNSKLFSCIELICDEILKNKNFLTELDCAIGDGDHGINMARGFAAVKTKLKDWDDTNLNQISKKIGMTLISTVGGASGPLYGTAFLRVASVITGDSLPTTEIAAKILEAAITGIKERGKAVRGEKTMLDALEPAYDAIIKAISQGKNLTQSLEAACVSALDGVEYTKSIRATKGRASYLGDRSIGHQDPGATSSYIILKAITDSHKTNYVEA